MITPEELIKEDDKAFNRLSKQFKEIYDRLPEEQQIIIWSLWDNGFFLDDRYEEKWDNIIIHPEDKGNYEKQKTKETKRQSDDETRR